MPRFTRYHLPGYCYFVTSVTRKRTPYFKRKDLAEIAATNLAFYRRRGDYLLHSYVIMPDHIHLLITPRELTISEVMRNVKSFIAVQVRREHGLQGALWQASFHDRIVRADNHLESAIEYIHANPVVAGLVQNAADYPYSSAHLYGPASDDQQIDRLVP